MAFGRSFPVPWRRPRPVVLHIVSASGAGSLSLPGSATPTLVYRASPLPNFQVLIDVSGHSPLTVPSVWTDFTSYCRKCSTRRGRQHVLDHYQPGTLTITFNGRDRVLDAENSAGPYFGLLDINRPIQVNVQYQGAWVPLFTGFIDSITPQWPNNVNEDIVYTASDGLRLLNTDTFTELSYAWAVLRDGARDLYAFGEFDIGSTAAQDSGPGAFPGTYTNVTLGVAGTSAADPTLSVALAGLPSSIGLNPAVLGTQWETAPWTIEFWLQPLVQSATSSGLSQQVLLAQDTSGLHGVYVKLAGTDTPTFSGGTLLVQVGSYGSWSVASPRSVTDGLWHHLVIEVSGTTGTVYLDGVPIGSYPVSLPAAACATAYLGGGFKGSLAYFAWYPSMALTQTQVSDHYNRGLWGFVFQSSLQRVADVLAVIDWPAAWTVIPADNAASMVQQPTGSLWLTTPLSYLQQIELAENGELFADVSGNINFRSRHWRQANMPTPLSIFGEGLAEVNYKPGFVLSRDNLDLYTAVLCQASVGPLGVPAGLPQQSISAAAEAKYGGNSVLSETGLLVTQDVECLIRSQWQLLRFSSVLPRLRSIVVDPLGDPQNRMATAVFRELGDLVSLNRRPPVGAAFSQQSYIEGVNHDVDFGRRTWLVTYALTPQTPVDTAPPWVLGTGLLGTSTVLGY